MLETLDTESLPLIQSLMVFAFMLLCLAVLMLTIFYFRRNPPDWKTLAEKLKNRPWSVPEAEAILMAIIALMLAGRTIIKAFYDLGIIPAAETDTYLIASQSLLFDVPIIILIIALLIRSRTIGNGILGYRPAQIFSALRHGALFCLAVLPVIGIVALVQDDILTKAGFENEAQYVIELFNKPGPFWMKIHLVFMSVVTAPITEEFMFRGIGISALADKTGMKWAVIILSLAFATIHFNLYAFGPLFVIAVAFSLAYIYTGSLLVPVFMHSIFNALNIAALLLLKQ